MKKCMIEHSYSKGLKWKQIKIGLDKYNGSSALIFVTIYNMVNEFKHSCLSTNDEHHLRCNLKQFYLEWLTEVVKIHKMVLNDQQIKLCKIVDATYMPQGTTLSISNEKLSVKISAKFLCCVCSRRRINRNVWSIRRLAWFLCIENGHVLAIIHNCGHNMNTQQRQGNSEF